MSDYELDKHFHIVGDELLNCLRYSHIDSHENEPIVLFSNQEYRSLTINNEIRVSFMTWTGGEKPYFIVVFNRSEKHVLQFDLTNLIAYEDNTYTWYLSSPGNSISKSVFDNDLDWLSKETSDENYRREVRKIKSLVNSGGNAPNTAYQLVENESWEITKKRFLELIAAIIQAHQNDNLAEMKPAMEGSQLSWTSMKTLDGEEANFDNEVKKSLADSIGRKKRLKKAKKRPQQYLTVVKSFQRNPDVVAEVLVRADGQCEYCGEEAPFIRKKDNSPYLEIHHEIRLVDGGEDTVDNAVALCPNCHRKAHFG